MLWECFFYVLHENNNIASRVSQHQLRLLMSINQNSALVHHLQICRPTHTDPVKTIQNNKQCCAHNSNVVMQTDASSNHVVLQQSDPLLLALKSRQNQ